MLDFAHKNDHCLWKTRAQLFSRLSASSQLKPENLIMPVMIVPGSGVERESASLPGQNLLSVDRVSSYLKRIAASGIRAVALFGMDSASETQPTLISQAIQTAKNSCPELSIIADLCVCQNTAHGHCGVIQDGHVDNDRSIALFRELALAMAEAGVDVLMPSSMMDGVVRTVREALDQSGYAGVGILAQSVKFASALYAPFRAGTASHDALRDKQGYQIDPGSSRQAIREAHLDIEEGADAVMVKPAFGYLDILSAVAESVSAPVAAFCTSGEYRLIQVGAELGHFTLADYIPRYLGRIKDAGADFVMTYFALAFAEH